MQQPLDLTYSAVFMGYLSQYRNYGGLWDIKSEGKTREAAGRGGGDGGKLRILLTAGSETAFALVTFMLRRGGEGQTYLGEYMVRMHRIDDLKDA